jgi:hypothetical protein
MADVFRSHPRFVPPHKVESSEAFENKTSIPLERHIDTTHLLPGKKRIPLEFTGLDDNSVAHGESFSCWSRLVFVVDDGVDGKGRVLDPRDGLSLVMRRLRKSENDDMRCVLTKTTGFRF